MYFTALDVETANNTAGSICAIGLVKFSNEKIVDQFYSLVQPPRSMGEFSHFNTKLHGISSSDVVSAPAFSEIFEEVDRFIDGGLIVAHNASFDARQVHAAMNYFDFRGKYNFACTLALSRRVLRLQNYKLSTVCSYLGIELEEHHHALDDAIASGKIYYILSGGNSKIPA